MDICEVCVQMELAGIKSISVGVLDSTELTFAKFRITLFLGKDSSNENLSRLFKIILMIILA